MTIDPKLLSSPILAELNVHKVLRKIKFQSVNRARVTINQNISRKIPVHRQVPVCRILAFQSRANLHPLGTSRTWSGYPPCGPCWTRDCMCAHTRTHARVRARTQSTHHSVKKTCMQCCSGAIDRACIWVIDLVCTCTFSSIVAFKITTPKREQMHVYKTETCAQRKLSISFGLHVDNLSQRGKPFVPVKIMEPLGSFLLQVFFFTVVTEKDQKQKTCVLWQM